MFAKLGKCTSDGCAADAMVGTFDENGSRTGKFCWEHAPPSPLNNSRHQANQENSGGQESDPAATQIAEDAENGCTGVFSGEHVLTLGVPHGRTHAGMCSCGWWRFIIADNYPKHPDEIIKEGHRVHLADVAAELNRGIKS